MLLLGVRNLIYSRVYLPILWSQLTKSKSPRKFSLPYIFLRLFPSPRSHETKMKVLSRFGGSSAWIETGTYTGDGAISISKFAEVLHTIEPSEELSLIAQERIMSVVNFTLHTGKSEDLLPEILKALISSGYKDLSLWLDGHYSGGITFCGELETPIQKELDTLAAYEKSFDKIQVFIDDIRCFNPSIKEFKSYPEIQFLLEYAKRHKLELILTKDICVMRKKSHVT